MSLGSFRWGTQKCIAMTIFSANVAIVKRNYESLTHFTFTETQGNILENETNAEEGKQ